MISLTASRAGLFMRQACAAQIRTISSSSWATAAASDEYTGPNIQDRIIRFTDNDGDAYFGIFSDESQTKARPILQAPDGKRSLSEETVDVVNVLSPIEPPCVYAIGLNYRAHAEEGGKHLPQYPMVFMKAPTSVIGHQQAIVIPRVANEKPEVDYEAELAVVIGKEARDVTKEEALDNVLGYTIANDVSARRWQGKKGGGQFVRAKSFDTFCPLGPYVVRANQIDPQNLTVKLWINGELMQDGHTSDMIFSVADIVSFLSQGTTLLPGTVILTGTPAGVGYVRDPPRYLRKGDVVKVEIEKLGFLQNTVGEETDFGVQFS